jgi:hypothetical protein
MAILRQVDSRSRSSASFLIWIAAGTFVAFSVIAGFSVGPLVAPIALVLLVWAALQSRHSAESAGFLVGCGTVLILIGYLHRNDVPCGSSGRLPVPAGSAGIASCGGFDAAPWFAAGSGTAALGFLVYGVYSFRAARSTPG